VTSRDATVTARYNKNTLTVDGIPFYFIKMQFRPSEAAKRSFLIFSCFLIKTLSKAGLFPYSGFLFDDNFFDKFILPSNFESGDWRVQQSYSLCVKLFFWSFATKKSLIFRFLAIIVNFFENLISDLNSASNFK
jgi:hypothetical protein